MRFLAIAKLFKQSHSFQPLKSHFHQSCKGFLTFRYHSTGACKEEHHPNTAIPSNPIHTPDAPIHEAQFSDLQSNVPPSIPSDLLNETDIIDNHSHAESNESLPPNVTINEKIIGSPETHAFKAETKRLLEIVANSLYSEKEIFIRELTSNAADACEKLKYFQLTHPDDLSATGQPPSIHISLDKEKSLFVIQDYGIGMTKSELEENLGTIALSGASKFLKQVAESGKSQSSNKIIGQFGVGFYSAFTVGSRVDVYSKSAHKDAKGYCWSSDGLGQFSLAEAENVEVGTKLVVHLREDEIRYADAFQVESIIKKYSNFVGFPVYLNGKQINTILPLWTLDKSSISDGQYDEFYKFIADSYENPQFRLHFSTDTPVQMRCVLFIPKSMPNVLFNTPENPQEGKMSLYSKNVLIKGKTNDLLPPWLSFVYGVVESEDIPLNLSRELLQNNLLIQKMKRLLMARVIKWLQEEQRKDPAAYVNFYKKAANYIKSGLLSDPQESKKEMMNLLLFDSNIKEAGSNSMVTFKDYVAAMKENQKEIYICLSKNRDTALHSPYYEPFAKKNLPVLFSYDPMDEFLVGALDSYDNHKIVRIEDAHLKDDSSSVEEEDESSVNRLSKDQQEALISWYTGILGNKVKSVKVSSRVMSQPVLIVDHAMHSMTMKYFKQLMAAQGQDDSMASGMMQSPPVDFEINPKHPLLLKLATLQNSQPELAKQIANQLFDNALIHAGLLEESQGMVTRLNSLLTDLVTKI